MRICCVLLLIFLFFILQKYKYRLNKCFLPPVYFLNPGRNTSERDEQFFSSRRELSNPRRELLNPRCELSNPRRELKNFQAPPEVYLQATKEISRRFLMKEFRHHTRKYRNK